MRKLTTLFAVICILTVPALAGEYTYDWADGAADYLGCFDGEMSTIVDPLCNHTDSAGSGLALQKETFATDGYAMGFLAAVWDLQVGDEVTVNLWRRDDNSNMPYFRLWSHYNDALENATDARGQDMEADDGSLGGNNDFGSQSGWEEFSYTWTIAEGHNGLVIDGVVYGDRGATIYVDDITITVPDHASVRLPNAIYESGGTTTPVDESNWTAVKAIFQ